MLDLTDHHYGRLTVRRFKEIIPRRLPRHGTYWYCDCSCGATDVVVSTKQLRTRNKPTRSCGCLMREIAREHAIAQHTHKESKGNGTPEYRCWRTIKNRCYNRRAKGYKNYGGRGIRVCRRWLRCFENFLEDMGRRPSPRYSIGRRNNNGNYTPTNCFWATDEEQRRNKRTTVLITINGVTKSRCDWLKELGVAKATYQWRIKQGWTPEEALLGR